MLAPVTATTTANILHKLMNYEMKRTRKKKKGEYTEPQWKLIKIFISQLGVGVTAVDD